MFQNRFHIVIPRMESSSLIMLGLLVINLAFNILANASFKISAFSPNWRGILTWQVIGNLAGFITVLTLTGLLRFMPLSIAFPLTTGLLVGRPRAQPPVVALEDHGTQPPPVEVHSASS